MNQITKSEVGGALDMIKAVADAIKELGSVPSGHLYARLMAYVDLNTYNKIIDILKRSEIVAEKNNELFWNVH